MFGLGIRCESLVWVIMGRRRGGGGGGVSHNAGVLVVLAIIRDSGCENFVNLSPARCCLIYAAVLNNQLAGDIRGRCMKFQFGIYDIQCSARHMHVIWTMLCFLLLSIGSFGLYPFQLLQWNGAYDCPSVHEATLENVDQEITCIYLELKI